MLQKLFAALLAFLFSFLPLQSMGSVAQPLAVLAGAAETDHEAQARRAGEISAALRSGTDAESSALLHSQALAVDEDGYYLISSAADLAAIKNDLAGKYRLTADISLNGKTFQPIGSLTAPFTGILDGGTEQYAIQSLNLNQGATLAGSDTVSLGLFALNAGTIQNIQLVNCSIVLRVSAAADADEPAAYAGGIAGYNVGRIENCYVTGNIHIDTGTQASEASLSCSAGGVAGFQMRPFAEVETGIFGTLCEADAAVTGTGSYYSYAGGILGYMMSIGQAPILYRCTAQGNASADANGSAAYAGGIIATAEGGRIEQCAAFGDAAAKSASSSAYAGGIAGMCAGAEILNCVAFGAANAQSSGTAYRTRYVCAGGLVGRFNYSSIQTSYAAGVPATSGLPTNLSGGGIGLDDNRCTALNCYYQQGTAPAGSGSGNTLFDPLTESALTLEDSYLGFAFALGNIWEMKELDGIGLRAYLVHAPVLPERTPEPEPLLPILRSRAGTTIIVDEEMGLVYGFPQKQSLTSLYSADGALLPDRYLYLENDGIITTTEIGAYIRTGYTFQVCTPDGSVIKSYTCVIFGDCHPDGVIDRSDVYAAEALIGTSFLPENRQGVPQPEKVALLYAGNMWGNISTQVLAPLRGCANGSMEFDNATIAADVHLYFRDYLQYIAQQQ